MLNDINFDNAVERLRGIDLRIGTADYALPVEPSLSTKNEVLARFGPLFATEHLPQLTETEFRSFLRFSNNRHWTGLDRLGPGICSDMEALRDGLLVLLDEGKLIEERYDYAIGTVYKLGRAVATPILQVVFPDKYGVWNGTSEAGLKRVGLWPQFDRGEREGSRYAKINEMLLQLASALGIDLWRLDALWYYLLAEEEIGQQEALIVEGDGPILAAESGEGQRFGLERHLHEFLRDNWALTEMGAEWELYREPGNDSAGYEYPCDVGRIDLLARRRKGGDWLIVELKRNQTGDQTVGQALRYMGWVKHNLAEAGEAVRGLIIAHKADASLGYAVSMMDNVDLMLYEVRFSLRRAPDPMD